MTAAEMFARATLSLVNRDDAFGRYRPLDRREAGSAITEKRAITTADFLRHAIGRKPDHVVGLHTTSAENTSRWGGLDVDCHAPDAEQAERNRATAQRLASTARGIGFAPLVEDSNGAGGYHVWLLFDGPVPTPAVFRLLGAIVAESGVDDAIELFPKQPRLDLGEYGNWLRLPGRHHSRAHVSRLSNGGTWATGDDMLRCWAMHPRTPAAQVHEIVGPEMSPDMPQPFPSPSREQREPLAKVSRERGSTDRGARLRAYVAAMPRGLGDGRKRATYVFACRLLHDFARSQDECATIVHAWNAKNTPPLEVERVDGIIQNAAKYGATGAAA